MASLEASSSNFNNVPKILKVSCTGIGGGGGGNDRLSDLPDAVICSILSSFRTKEAVRTSVLSTRWRYVWTSVPHIEIDDVYHNNILTSLEYKERFKDFVDRVLRLNTMSSLPKAVLDCSDYYDGRFPKWIRALTVRKIDELDLGYGGEPHVMLPHWLFMCKDLVILNLHDHFVLDVPTLSSVRLLHLKVLRLDSVQIFDENTMQNLLAGCPVLEELKIEGNLEFLYRTQFMMTLYIQTSSLKSLTVNHRVFDKTSILIDAVNLERIDVTIIDEIERFDVQSNLSSLVSVGINLGDLSPNCYLEPLRKMSTTKYLCLSRNTMQSLSSANLNDLPMFPYLTHLELEIIDYSWSVLPHLLRCSPNLITFGLDLDCEYDPDENEEFDMPNFSMLHLESVNLHRLGWSNYEMDMVKYFLKYAPVLKKMSLYFVDPPEDSNLLNELVTLPRSSTDCDLEISFQ